jgi:hypothetical protein
MLDSTVERALDKLTAQLFTLYQKDDPYFCRFQGLFPAISTNLALAELKEPTIMTEKPFQDHLRRQMVHEDIPYSIRDSLLPVRLFLQRLFDRLGSLVLDTFALGDMSLVVSYPGCRRQEWHTDYDHASGSARKNFAVLFGLQSSRLEYFACNEDGILVRDTLSFRKGDLVVFRGDMVHAGSAYTAINAQVHCYIESVTHPARSPDSADYVYYIDPRVQASAHAHALNARRKRRRLCLALGRRARPSPVAAASPAAIALEEGVRPAT